MSDAILGSNRLRVPLWLLVLVTLSGTMAMHIFVPALPVAGAALGATPSGMQQTITLYVMGLAVGQLVYGPVSDTWGRRPALLVGLTLYLVGSFLALCAPSLSWLVAARLLQALGGAAGITLGRAIIRDTAADDRVTKDLALLNLLTLIGPGLGPIMGAYLADLLGWRSIYLFLVFMACIMLLCAWRLLPETNFQRRPLAFNLIVSDYQNLLTNSRFVAFLVGGACSSTALYPYLATAPYIVHEQLGLPISSIGWFAASTIAGAGVGTIFTRKLVGRFRSQNFLYLGAGIGLCMALLFMLVQALGILSPVMLLLIMVVMTFGAGVAGPVALSGALGAAPKQAGAAAGLYGFGQMAMGALGTWLVGLGDIPALACAVSQAGITAVALLFFRMAAVRPSTKQR